jgi:hypothetical protein
MSPNTVKNRYKGNLIMKIDTFYWWSAFEIIPESKIKNQQFSPLFKEKKLPPHNNCSNHVHVEFYCASNDKIKFHQN